MARPTGIPQVYQREDGRWATQLTLPSGKRKYLYGKTKAEVTAKLRDALAAQERGALIGTERETFSSFVDRWLEYNKARLAPQTVLAYDNNLRHLMPHLGRKRLGQLRPDDFMRCYANLQVSPIQIYATHGAARQVLAWAVKLRILAWNPAGVVDIPEPSRRESRAMTTEQIQKLLTPAEGDRLHALWALLIATGLRISEALALRWDDLDTEAGTLAVIASQLKVPGQEYQRGPTKTPSSQRVREVGPELARVLATHRVIQKKERLAAERWEDHALIFCRPDGHPMHRRVALSALQEALSRAALPHFTLHELRHTAASALYAESDIPLEWTREVLGHTTVSMTQRYSHMRHDTRREVSLRLDSLLRKA